MLNLKRDSLRSTSASLILLASLARAGVPGMISYQGRVTVDGVNFDGEGLFKFALVNEAGDVSYWSNDDSSEAGREPEQAVPLKVVAGLYSILLGDESVEKMKPIPAATFTNDYVALRVWFDDGANGSLLLNPDQRIAAVGYALTAAAVPDGAITSSMLAPGSVTAAALASNAVTAASIASGAVGSNQLAAGAVQGDHIAAGAIQASHLADGAVGPAQLAKAPQAGSLASFDLDMVFDEATFEVRFPRPFSSVPAVTLNIESKSSSIVDKSRLSILSCTPAGFTGRWSMRQPVIVEPSGASDGCSSWHYWGTIGGMAYFDSTEGGLKVTTSISRGGDAWAPPIILDPAAGTPGGRRVSLQSVLGSRWAVAYFGSGRLRYARSTDWYGRTWGPVMDLDTTGADDGLSLAVVNDRPAVAYYKRSPNADLMYVRADEPNGDQQPWQAPIAVYTPGDAGRHCVLLTVNGRPAIACQDGSQSDLLYFRAADAAGASWPPPVRVYTNGAVGAHASMAIVDGRPGIVCADNSEGSLLFFRADDVDGATWASPVRVDPNCWSEQASLAVLGGVPAVAYVDRVKKELRYATALDAEGRHWAPPVVIGSYFSQYIWPALGYGRDDTGSSVRRAMSYQDTTEGRLKYLRENLWPAMPWHLVTTGDVGGHLAATTVTNGGLVVCYQKLPEGDLMVRSTSGALCVVDTVGIVGLYTSMAVVNGFPAISYYDLSNADLKYVRASNIYGSVWSPPLRLDTPDFAGKHTSLKVVNGNPAISYYHETATALRYIRATDPDGDAWGAPVTVDRGGEVGEYTSLTIVDGHPAISYYDRANGDLRFVRATDADGTAWAAPVTVDAEGDSGQYSFLLVVNGRPAIGYYRADTGSLKYTRAADATGAAWAAPVTVDTEGDVGRYLRLAIVDNTPYIVYYDATQGDLKHCRAADATGSAWSPPLRMDTLDDVGAYVTFDRQGENNVACYLDATHGYIESLRLSSPFSINWVAVEP